MPRLLRRYGPPAFTLLVFVCVALALHHELGRYNWRDVKRSLGDLADWRIWLALALAFGSYFAAGLNDFLGVRYAGRRLGLGTTSLVGFISYAISYNVGFTAVGGTAMRYQLYTARGLSAMQIAKVVLFECASFFIGVGFLGGVLLLFGVPALTEALRLPAWIGQAVGAVFLGVLAAYFRASWLGVGEIRFRGWRLGVPRPRLAAGQVFGSLVDISLAAATMYVLLPGIGLTYFEFLPLFLAAMLTGLASTVPGGLGVLEAVMLVMLRGHGDAVVILGGLLAYRVVYYLVPLAVAVLLLVVTTYRRRHREMLGLIGRTLDRVPALLPRVLGVTTYLAGVFLLLTGVLPPDPDHLRWLSGFFPLFVSEIASVVSAVLGVSLLFLARGIQRRLRNVHRLTVLVLFWALGFAMLRGLDYAAALVMALTLLALLAGADTFDRDKPLFTQAFGGQWFSTTLMVLALVLLVCGISFQSNFSEFSSLWRVDWPEQAGRDLRAGLSALVAGVMLGLVRLGQSRRFVAGLDRRGTVTEARELALRHGVDMPEDAYMLFSPDRRAVLFYEKAGGRWISRGMPVGPPEPVGELVWTFTDMAEMSGAMPLFEGIPVDGMEPFLKAGYIPVVYHPDKDEATAVEDSRSECRIMTRSMVFEIRSFIRGESVRLRRADAR